MKTPIIKRGPSTEVLIIRTLQEFGVPANLSGYLYLRTGMEILLENPSKISSMTKEVYPEIAKEHGTTPSRVERAIRHVIERTFDNLGVDGLVDRLGPCASIRKGKATNSEFMAALAEDLRIEMNVYGRH